MSTFISSIESIAGGVLNEPFLSRALELGGQHGSMMENEMRIVGVICLYAIALGSATGPSVCRAQTAVRRPATSNGSLAAYSLATQVDAADSRRTLIGMQYESYFFHSLYLPGFDPGSGTTAEAVPLLGRYNSYDVSVIKKHEATFEYLGIDWLLLDWSNMLSMTPAWEEHKGATRELEQTTTLLFKVYSELQKQGLHPPKLVIMLGWQGPATTQPGKRLDKISAWLQANLLNKPEYKDLWLYYQGKPLLTVLDVTNCTQLPKLNEEFAAGPWTVRWMGSQLQDSHAEDCGFWSWMDGPIQQKVTYRNGIAEETVVTPASFPMPPTGTGWLDSHAAGRDHGVPYLESWEVAFESRPKFIQIHQWNEFAGQTHPRDEPHGAASKHIIYGDEYNLEFSDDIEPTQVDACTNSGCGGWGYYYVNLTKALISLYRGETPDITVMALSGPAGPGTIGGQDLPLTWTCIGKQPRSYSLRLDGTVIAKHIRERSYSLDLTRVTSGKHQVTLLAEGVHTYFDLNAMKRTKRTQFPIPVVSSISFTYSPGAD